MVTFIPFGLKLTEIEYAKQKFVGKIHRGSYTSAHVLLNLLYMLGKSIKMRGMPSILSQHV